MSNLRGVEFIAFIMGSKRITSPLQIFSWLPTNFNTFALAFFLWYNFFFCKTEISPFFWDMGWASEMEGLIPGNKFQLRWSPEREVPIPSLLRGHDCASVLPFPFPSFLLPSPLHCSFLHPSFSHLFDTLGCATLAPPHTHTSHCSLIRMPSFVSSQPN